MTGAATMVWPLMVISQEDNNSQEQRIWAAKLLHRIGSTMGIRPATLLANTISKSPQMSQPPFPGLNVPQSSIEAPLITLS